MESISPGGQWRFGVGPTELPELLCRRPVALAVSPGHRAAMETATPRQPYPLRGPVSPCIVHYGPESGE